MNQLRGTFLFAVFLFVFGGPLLGADSEWGHLCGRFLYDGDPPPVKLLPVPDSHRNRIGGKEIPDESLVVGEDGGIANVFVWLRPAIGVKPPIHPSYEATEENAVEFVARDLRLQPHALILRTSQVLRFRHADEKIGYNLKFDSFANSPYCGLVSVGQITDIHFERSERVPMDISCNIHPWIRARMLVLDHPYAAVTDREGRFTIRNLPVGTWDFVVLHERSGYIKQPKIAGEQLEWRRGAFQQEIAAGDNAIGDILVAPDEFERN